MYDILQGPCDIQYTLRKHSQVVSFYSEAWKTVCTGQQNDQGLEWGTWPGHCDLQAGLLSSPLAEGIE